MKKSIVSSFDNKYVEIEMMEDMLEEAAAQDYNMYLNILRAVLSAVPRKDMKSILDYFEDEVYGG